MAVRCLRGFAEHALRGLLPMYPLTEHLSPIGKTNILYLVLSVILFSLLFLRETFPFSEILRPFFPMIVEQYLLKYRIIEFALKRRMGNF